MKIDTPAIPPRRPVSVGPSAAAPAVTPFNAMRRTIMFIMPCGDVPDDGWPEISVILPVGPRADARSAIHSVLAQTMADWELLVAVSTADGGPADLTAFTADARVKIIGLNAWPDHAAARNRALLRARGRTIAYIDTGDEIAADYFEQVLRYRQGADVLVFNYDTVDERAGALIAGGDVAGGETDVSQTNGETSGLAGAAGNVGSADADGNTAAGLLATSPPRRTHRPGAQFNSLFHRNIAVPVAVTHARPLLDRIGLWDEGAGASAAWDLWKRFARGGARYRFMAVGCGTASV